MLSSGSSRTMAVLLRPRRSLLASITSRNLATTSTRFGGADNPGWGGRKPDDHVANTEDELDIQSGATKSGKRQRAEESHPTSAATEKDTRNDNEQAKKDHPEAPGPVIGMNSERGGVSTDPSTPDVHSR